MSQADYEDERPEELEHDFFSDSVHYKSTSQKRKERIMATQQITISAVTREPKNFGEETIWGVKVGNSWMDLHVDEKPSKGQSPTVETWNVEGKNGRTYVHARPVAGQQPAQPAAPSQQPSRPVQSPNGNRATSYAHSFGEYVAVARKAHAFASELEPGEAGARGRTALVSTFLIAFGDGQFGSDVPKPGDEWGDVTPSGPTKYEKAEGHVHLERTIWLYFERIGGNADDAQTMLFEVSGKQDVLELSEKEAIAARLKAEKIIDEKTDYGALFEAEARKIAKEEGWVFSLSENATEEEKKANIVKKKDVLIKAKITKKFTELTQADLKAAWLQLTDDIPF